jgi:sterol desaturase/sphingolipid hydroxylase (fatty acid hydroxylase superfamily)
MSNASTFLWLFFYVQLGFIAVDLYEHRRHASDTGTLELIRKNLGLVVGVVAACMAYFALQIVLASALPTIRTLTAAAKVTVSISIKHQPLWNGAAFLVAFFAATLFDYLVHRFLLHGPLFSLHENHHLPSIVSNVMPGIAARPFVAVPNFLINACSCATVFGLARLSGRPELISASIHVLPALLLTFAFVASASHSIFLRRFDWVDKIFRGLLLVSPREHLLHHAAMLKGNYGNFTLLWDQIFHTRLSRPLIDDFRLGLDYDQDFLGAITGGRFKLSIATRVRYQLGHVCHLTNPRDI